VPAFLVLVEKKTRLEFINFFTSVKNIYWMFFSRGDERKMSRKKLDHQEDFLVLSKSYYSPNFKEIIKLKTLNYSNHLPNFSF